MEADTALQNQLGGVRVPFGTLALLLHLSKLRSEFIVARALAEKFPSEESWVAFVSSPVTVEEMSAFAEVVRDMRLTKPLLTPEEVEHSAAPHLGRTLEAVSLAAETLGVTAEDLVNALITA